MTKIEEVKTCIKAGNDSIETMDLIDSLSWNDRVLIREELRAYPLPKNLFYDYDKQCWITEDLHFTESQVFGASLARVLRAQS